MRLSYFKTSLLSNLIPNGQDGNFESNGDIKHDYFEPNSEGFCYRFFNDFIVNSGHTISTTVPCKGLYIYVKNLAIIDGIISMNFKGVYSPPTGEYINGYTPLGLDNLLDSNYNKINVSLPGLNKLATGANSGSNGGLGGGSQAYNSTGAGSAGVFGSGSGAGGGYYYTAQGYNQFGGGPVSKYTTPGNAAQDYGGLGGKYIKDPISKNHPSGSGQGYPNIFTYDNTKNQEIEVGTLGIDVGVSGVIYLICNILKDSTGQLLSIGSNPPIKYGTYYKYSTSTVHYNTYSYPGGCSGGGSITLLYRQKNNSNIILNVNGASTLTSNNCASYKSGNGSTREFQFI